MSENSIDQLLGFSRDHQDQLTVMTQTLVGAFSANPPGDISKVAAAAVDIIQRTIPSAEVRTYESARGITNVVAIVRGSGPGKRLVFSGHLDTYPLGNEASWEFTPLGGRLSDDGKRLYGRGAADMKGGIAASIMAVRALAEHRGAWNGEVVLALAGDEETMGTLGSEYLLENVEVVRGADAIICGDAGSPLVVRIGEKGLVWIEVHARGVSAHGAHVHKGANAIERLVEAITALKALEKLPVSAPKEVDEVISTAKPVSERLSGTGEEDTLKRITVNIGTISGGTSPNLVPDSAQFEADIRLPMGISTSYILEHIHEHLDPLDGISFRITREYDPTWTSPTEKIVRYALDAAKSIVDQDTVLNMRVGASDSRLFRRRNIPTVVLGLTPYNMGGPDEYLVIEELCQVAQIHTMTAFNFLSK
ncbi:hypothetical protein F5X99DRAFT_349601 [Biscogniauxia marginata]|nr:hypothetical protein F5X99DRAFT_349601 [Biscogniauxia marginata]